MNVKLNKQRVVVVGGSSGMGLASARLLAEVGAEVTIASDPPQPIVGDGEKWGETPVTIKVLPGAIGVIAPADAS